MPFFIDTFKRIHLPIICFVNALLAKMMNAVFSDAIITFYLAGRTA